MNLSAVHEEATGKRMFEFHTPPPGHGRIGDFQVWEVLLSEGRETPEYPQAFAFYDRMLHQPVFLPVAVPGADYCECVVWDVNNGDVVYCGPQGPPLDKVNKTK